MGSLGMIRQCCCEPQERGKSSNGSAKEKKSDKDVLHGPLNAQKPLISDIDHCPFSVPPVQHPKDLHNIKAEFPKIPVPGYCLEQAVVRRLNPRHALAHAGLDQNFQGRDGFHGTTYMMYPGVIPVKRGSLIDQTLLNIGFAAITAPADLDLTVGTPEQRRRMDIPLLRTCHYRMRERGLIWCL